MYLKRNFKPSVVNNEKCPIVSKYFLRMYLFIKHLAHLHFLNLHSFYYKNILSKKKP